MGPSTAGTELAHRPASPYIEKLVQGREIGLPVDGEVKVEYYTHEATSLDEARGIFADYGVVVLGEDCKLELNGQPTTVGEAANSTTASLVSRLQTLWAQPNRDEIIRPKDYDAYNGTERHMRTIAYDRVLSEIPEVHSLQQNLLPTIRQIAGEQTVEISTDPDEGTVVNLQLFSPNSDPAAKQEHGAHTDRVDTTVIICLANNGPGGELVFVDGYTDACLALNLDPHQNFQENLSRLMSADPDRLTFRAHRFHPGAIAVLKTDKDIHYITPKTYGDVLQDNDGEKLHVGDQILGRGVINMAFETEHCRQIDEVARRIEAQYDLKTHESNGHEAFFAALDGALFKEFPDKKDDETLLAVRSAIVTRLSAADLYT